MAKRVSQLTELTVVAVDDYIPIVDTSAGDTKKVSVKNLTGSPDFGWTATGESWSFSSWTAASNVGVITVPTDATTKYTVGNFVRIAQATGGTKYGQILSLTSTTLSVWMPGYTLNNEAITSPVYSPLGTPVGLPIAISDGQPYRFSANRLGSANQGTTAGVSTKVIFGTEAYDANSNFDNVTNYRFTAPVTGLYFLNAIIQTLLGTTATDSNLQIYKNGTIMRKGGNLKNGVYPQHQVVGQFPLTAGDYCEVYFVNISANDSIEGSNNTSNAFEGYLISRT